MSSDSDLSKRVWIEGGILYAEYINSMSAAEVLEREEFAVKLLNQVHIDTIPFILILTNVDKSTLTIKLSEYGKILTAYGFMKRVSGIWTVGAPENLKSYVLPIVSSIFGKRFYFVDSLEKAKIEARKYISDSSSLLE